MNDEMKYELNHFIELCGHCHTKYGVNPCRPSSKNGSKCKDMNDRYFCSDITTPYSIGVSCYPAIQGRISYK